jgi:hypothetical protein
MNTSGVIERVERIAAVRAAGDVDAATLQSGLVAVREARAWLDAQHAGLVARLNTVSSFPESAIADADRCSVGAAGKTKERAETLAATPKLADALADGVITAGHIDAVTRTSKSLDADQRDDLFTRADQLTAVAAAGTVDEFRRRLEFEVKSLQRDDGMDRLSRQRRATSLRTWVDNDSMWNVRAKFDPMTGIGLNAKIDAMVETLFAERTPDTAPADPIAKQDHLRALAMARLLEGAASGKPGRAEWVAVIDADAPSSHPSSHGPVVEFPIPVELPARVIAELAGQGDIHAVVVRNGVVLYAPGDLDLGRTTRLANRAQRRALRGLYRCCAIPGCTVGFDRCKLHHVIWWRHGGCTDLDNLLPLCTVHHGKVHNDGWVLALGPNRELTVRLPDGTVRSTGPPRRSAAA